MNLTGPGGKNGQEGMLSKLRKFFSGLFRKKHPPLVKDQKPRAKSAEKKPEDKSQGFSEDITSPGGIPEKESQETAPSEKAEHTWAEKHARRRANREKRKSETKRKTARLSSPKSPAQQISRQTNKHGFPILRENDSLFELFAGEKDENQADGESPGMSKHCLTDEAFQRLLQEKKEGGGPVRPMRVIEQIRNYPLPEAELDLHGYTARKAETKTEAFICTAHRKGLRTLRIIVGKGTRSKGRAVLPDVVEDIVVRLKKRHLVLTFKWEKHTKLRSGAMIVYLR